MFAFFRKQQRDVKQCLCQYIEGKKLPRFQVKCIKCERVQIARLGHLQAGLWAWVSISAPARWPAAHLFARHPGAAGGSGGAGSTDIHLVKRCGFGVPLAHNLIAQMKETNLSDKALRAFTGRLAHQSSRLDLNKHSHDILRPRVRREGGWSTHHPGKGVPCWTS